MFGCEHNNANTSKQALEYKSIFTSLSINFLIENAGIKKIKFNLVFARIGIQSE